MEFQGAGLSDRRAAPVAESNRDSVSRAGVNLARGRKPFWQCLLAGLGDGPVLDLARGILQQRRQPPRFIRLDKNV